MKAWEGTKLADTMYHMLVTAIGIATDEKQVPFASRQRVAPREWQRRRQCQTKRYELWSEDYAHTTGRRAAPVTFKSAWDGEACSESHTKRCYSLRSLDQYRMRSLFDQSSARASQLARNNGAICTLIDKVFTKLLSQLKRDPSAQRIAYQKQWLPTDSKFINSRPNSVYSRFHFIVTLGKSSSVPMARQVHGDSVDTSSGRDRKSERCELVVEEEHVGKGAAAAGQAGRVSDFQAACSWGK
ncbi:hypothetical protein AB1Y20_012720 [Prymnesium parvum]|uniref:Uncharacterized protein n=1 Tax=Prymnesium parvum TaxID=97485 RepID=A0AB34IJH5_PRYPA